MKRYVTIKTLYNNLCHYSNRAATLNKQLNETAENISKRVMRFE